MLAFSCPEMYNTKKVTGKPLKGKTMLNIVLLEPEIPANTGNIGRTCVITGTRLHLIEPMGFRISERHLVRAGLDYWPRLDVTVHMDLNAFYESVLEEYAARSAASESSAPTKSQKENEHPLPPRIFYATTKGRHRYSDVRYRDGDYIMFGKESAGIPEEVLVQHPEECIRIPMKPEERSLNLSNAAAIVLYEALRQLDFPSLETKGELHRLHW